MTQIRLARPDEVDTILQLEDDAGRLYGQAGMPEDLPGLARDEVERSIAQSFTWVAVDDVDRPIAFALCQPAPDAIHLRELDVAPTHMRRGLGRRLIEHVCAEARARGLPQVTLTTFEHVPWNAPLYRRYGFRDLSRAQMPAWLRAIRDEEDASVLAGWPRLAMAIECRAIAGA